MKKSISNAIHSLVTASVIASGLGVSAQAGELRLQVRPSNGIGGLTIGTSQGGGSRSLADLVIGAANKGTNGMPNSGYCGPWNGGNNAIQLHVRNFGNANAPASQILVQFVTGATINVAVPAIPGGATTAVISVPIPANAWPQGTQYNNSVNFTLTANITGTVSESNVSNNEKSGTCLGPVT